MPHDPAQKPMEYPGLMVSVSGVRGRVGEALTPEIITKFAAGFGAWALSHHSSKTIVVGRDSRVSGPMFHHAVIAALQSVGAQIIDVGIAPTPTIQLAVEHHHAAGGLAITASHNPIEWNALKFIASSGLFLDPEESRAMRAVVESPFPRATWDTLGTISWDDYAIGRHIDKILALPFLDVEGIREHEFHVVLDCVRGAGGLFMPRLLDQFGCIVEAINLEADGRFPRSPEPIAENLGEVEALVQSTKSAIGFVVDPDVDRLALISDQGKAIGEDYTLALAASVVLRHRSGPLVTNLSTSRIVDDVAARANTHVVRAPVGEVNVATRMRQEHSPVGGEGNGGVILTEMHLGRDAPVAVALILQLLHEENRPLSAIVNAYPRYAIVKDKLTRPNTPLDTVYQTLRTTFADAEVDTQDGLRLSWPDRWVHVRPSGTEPIVRVIAEAPTEAEAQALIQAGRSSVESLT
jgi:phosphomannomutase